MQIEIDSQKKQETPISSGNATQVETPDFNKPVRPIADLLGQSDFPQCALGEYVDCGGYLGVVVQIVKESIKIRSQEGTTRSFNVNGLRRLYGPRLEPTPPSKLPEPTPAPIAEAAEKEVVQAPPASVVIPEPDFNQPVTSIATFAADPDYPQCTFGKLVDFGGFMGVVVELVNGSMKVRSKEETTRSYNIRRMRELHGPQTRLAAV